MKQQLIYIEGVWEVRVRQSNSLHLVVIVSAAEYTNNACNDWLIFGC